MTEIRLDKILVDRKLVSSRVRAEQIIQEFGVLVNGKLINKTGKKFDENVEIKLISDEIPWVSKGAFQLLSALENWQINVTDKPKMRRESIVLKSNPTNCTQN
jgi:23S rRNA (cytidine1920-2'-O)/16S rRNA (cytidine1409-2'-O)-methyltransferase